MKRKCFERQTYLNMETKLICFALLFTVHYATCLSDCVVQDIAVDTTFDLEKLWGVWYEVEWIVPRDLFGVPILDDYTETFTIQQDGNITVKGHGSFKQPCDTEINHTLYLTENPAKMFKVLHQNGESVEIIVWILKNDSDYLLTYTCDVMDETTGICEEASSQILSRQNTISNDKLEEAYAIAAGACLNEEDYVKGTQENECTALTKECVVDEIAVQQNLDLEKFLGTWYEIKWIIPIYRKDITPLADYTETYKKGTGENITITGQASYEKSCDKNFSTTLYQTEDPAKMLLVPPRNVKTNIHAVPYWILKLEDTYMVTYTCDVLNEISGTCDHVSANIWSRSSTLSDDKLQQAYGIAEEACLDKMDFVDISQENDCNTASSGHEVIASHGLLWSIVLISLYIQHLR